MNFEPIDIKLQDGAIVTLREANSTDAGQVLSLVQSCLQTAEYLLESDGEVNLTVEHQKEWIEKITRNPQNKLWVAVNDGEIIGSMEIRRGEFIKNKHIGVVGLILLKRWRGRGLGSRLFKILVEWAEDDPCIEILELEVYGDNLREIALYRKFGFVKEGYSRKYLKMRDGTYEDKLTMRLRLNKHK